MPGSAPVALGTQGPGEPIDDASPRRRALVPQFERLQRQKPWQVSKPVIRLDTGGADAIERPRRRGLQA